MHPSEQIPNIWIMHWPGPCLRDVESPDQQKNYQSKLLPAKVSRSVLSSRRWAYSLLPRSVVNKGVHPNNANKLFFLSVAGKRPDWDVCALGRNLLVSMPSNMHTCRKQSIMSTMHVILDHAGIYECYVLGPSELVAVAVATAAHPNEPCRDRWKHRERGQKVDLENANACSHMHAHMYMYYIAEFVNPNYGVQLWTPWKLPWKWPANHNSRTVLLCT